MGKMSKNEIRVNPEVLIRLAELSGFNKEEISEKLKIPIENINEGRLSIAKLKKLAETLKHPLAAFFLNEVPEINRIPDYRINRNKKINREVLLAQRRLNYLIERLKQLTNIKSRIPDFSTTISPTDLAKEFRNYLEIELIKKQKPQNILDNYKNKIEEKLNIIIIEYPFKPKLKKIKKQIKENIKTGEIDNDVRAFSIYDSDISGIVLNESDQPSIKLFSLFHEVCHILRKNSGICSLDYKLSIEETYCNEFAAEFLVPASDLKETLQKYEIKENNFFSIVKEISGIYGVSYQVILLRLLSLEYITQEEYDKLMKELTKNEIKSTSGGYRNWSKVFKNRVGNVVLKNIRSLLNKGEISFYEALTILDINHKYAEELLYAN